MGYRWPSRTTAAERRMLRAIELNPHYEPSGPRAEARFERLIRRGLIHKPRKKGPAKVFPKSKRKPKEG